MRFFVGAVLASICLSGCAQLFGWRNESAQFDSDNCTISSGYAFALSGGRYDGGCAADEEPAFLTGYVLGRRVAVQRYARRTAQTTYENALYEEGPHGRSNRYEAAYKVPPSERPEQALRDDMLQKVKERLDRTSEDLALVERTASLAVAENRPVAIGGVLALDRDVLASAHAFARSNDAIDHCTDNKPFHGARCIVNPGALLVDAASGAICAEGAGELRFEASEPRKIGDLDGRADIYSFHRRGKAENRSPAESVVLISAAGQAPEATCVPARLDR